MEWQGDTSYSALPGDGTPVPEHEDEEEALSFDLAAVKLCKGSIHKDVHPA